MTCKNYSRHFNDLEYAILPPVFVLLILFSGGLSQLEILSSSNLLHKNTQVTSFAFNVKVDRVTFRPSKETIIIGRDFRRFWRS